MLTKNPDSGQAGADVRRATRKRVRGGSSAAVTEIINEPKSDWVPPGKAPFYCFSDRYIRSAGEWADALQAKVRNFIESKIWTDAVQTDQRRIFEAEGISEAEQRSLGLIGEWSFGRATKAPGAWITAMGIRTDIEPGTVSVRPIMPGDDDRDDVPKYDFDRWLILGSTKEILNAPDWNAGSGIYLISLDQKVALQWHRRLLRYLFSSWEGNFARVIEPGTAHIMARKHSILAPFERITWNQWQYFRLDEHEELLPKDIKWGDPRSRDWWSELMLWAATGPGGEKLYEIHIAPGSSDRNREKEPEEHCLQWLKQLSYDYPDRPPKRRDALGEEAISEFPGLTFNAFLRCWVQVATQNPNWSRPGAPPKSPKKIAAANIDHSAIFLSRRKVKRVS